MGKCVVLIGPPCSGKSTVGKELASNLKYKYVSSGDIARKMAERDGSTDNLNAGNMAPEDEMRFEITLVFNGENIVLDGFPRFEEQWEWMHNRFKGYEFAYVVIDVPTLTLFNRVVHRGRVDDVAFIERLEYYMKNTVPMVNKIDNYGISHNNPVVAVVNTTVVSTVISIERYLDDCGWI